MDSSSSYASIDMQYSSPAGHGAKRDGRAGVMGRGCLTPKTPEAGRATFKCQSRAMWTLIIAATAAIQHHYVFSRGAHAYVHFFINTLLCYEIFANWRLVKLKNPIFNDGVWFDNPPRGWDFCVECHHHRPPRSHHCPVCDVCILKRNHHCYFTGACIGLGNQRNFVFFLSWIVIGTTYAVVFIAPLLSIYYIPFEFTLKSVVGYFIPPLYVFLPLLGYSTWVGTFFIFMEMFLFVALLIAASLLFTQLKLILNNCTEYEHAKHIATYSQRGIIFNLRLVFGQNLFLLPFAFVWPKFYVRSRESDCIYGRPQYTKVM